MVMGLTRSEELIQQAYDAEDKGGEVYIQYVEGTEIVEYVEVSGREYLNEEVKDELDDLHWADDAYRVADHYWRN